MAFSPDGRTLANDDGILKTIVFTCGILRQGSTSQNLHRFHEELERFILLLSVLIAVRSPVDVVTPPSIYGMLPQASM